jgi:hypothetical protein
VRAYFGVAKRVGFIVNGAIGGFGIGSSSKFTWDAGAYAVIGIGKYVAVHVGYRVLQYEREDNGMDMKLTMSGPQIGLSILF